MQNFAMLYEDLRNMRYKREQSCQGHLSRVARCVQNVSASDLRGTETAHKATKCGAGCQYGSAPSSTFCKQRTRAGMVSGQTTSGLIGRGAAVAVRDTLLCRNGCSNFADCPSVRPTFRWWYRGGGAGRRRAIGIHGHGPCMHATLGRMHLLSSCLINCLKWGVVRIPCSMSNVQFPDP
jgi:hypothetical protein